MCSIGEDDFGDDGAQHAMVQDPNPSPYLLDSDTTCKKCESGQAFIHLDFKEPMCKICFLNYVRHKFRASLGSTKIVRKGSSVLVVFDASAENFVLLDMLKYATEQDQFKRLQFSVELLFVDDSFLFPDVDREANLAEKLAVLEQFDFKCHYVSLASTGRDEIQEFRKGIAFKADMEEKFMAQLESKKDLTTQQDFLDQIWKKTLRWTAKQLNYRFVFTSDIALNLTKTLLTNIALGRGSAAAFDVSFCDNRTEEVQIVRPIRDLTPAEVAVFIQVRELQHLTPKRFGGGLPSSIQNLTGTFVDDLQKNFPSTVSTVYRTGNKIASGISPEVDFCELCLTPLDVRGSESHLATEFSRILDERVNESPDKLEELAEESARKENNYCFSCRKIFL